MSTIYDFSVQNPKGEEISLGQYKGKVLLVVNTATGCGFTPQYKDLESLYEEFHEQGLEIIDIPCNQFLGQAPGTDEEIHEFCTLHYNTQFPQMKKSDVNGEQELPLYTYLKSQKGFEGFTGVKAPLMNALLLKEAGAGFKNSPDIKWNFTKFLISRSGEVLRRFEPTESMKKVREAVAEQI
jgi:glutathione peroxidase